MMGRVRLPKLEFSQREGAKGHPFPLAASIQAQQLLQASVFHATVQGLALKRQLSSQAGLAELRATFRAQSGDDELWDECFGYVIEYAVLFDNIGFQDVVVQMASHWDWFIRRLAGFLLFALRDAGQKLTGQSERNLQRLGRSSVDGQLRCLREDVGLKLSLMREQESGVCELFLVRHLGLHNRWEVDADYLRHTESPDWQLGDLRLVELPELMKWQRCMTDSMGTISSVAAQAFVASPGYDGAGSAV
jgi:hypothetical protein